MFKHTHPLFNSTGPSLNPPACAVLAVSRIIIYLYLNTHKAYTGKGNHHTGKTRLYTEQEEMEKMKKNKKQIKVTLYRGSGGY